ncbi:MAG: LLM class flavin-dependent oxidoreductase [Thermoleophilia bacterium]|nr:LLM class flavin-dependent oxidoreductase [Thermoleophilia bacterium]
MRSGTPTWRSGNYRDRVMDYSCGLAPGRDAPELAALAESVGFRRIWLWDSPALHGDIWMWLALVARSTHSVGIGPGLTVPSLRHVMVTATAAATLEQLAPGRTAIAVGTGFSARLLLGQEPMTWADLKRHIRQLKGLLRGDEVEVGDRVTQMLHMPQYAPPRPLEIPVVVAANGPKGLRVAHELGDGVMSVKTAIPGFDWSIVAGSGTVLDEGESAASPRVLQTVGPYLTMLYHYFYELPTAVDLDALPGGREWRKEVDAVPESVRHLRLHATHMVAVDERDRSLVTAEAVRALTWTDTPVELRRRFAEFEAGGATEIYYQPSGPDLRREIVAFARAVGIGG